MLLLTLTLEQEEYRSSGVQEFRSSGVQEFRSSGVQEFRSSGVQEFRRKEEFWRALRLLRSYFGRTKLRSDLSWSKGHNPPLEKNFSGSHSDVGLESLSHSSFWTQPLLHSFLLSINWEACRRSLLLELTSYYQMPVGRQCIIGNQLH